MTAPTVQPTTAPPATVPRTPWSRWAAFAVLIVAVATRFHGLSDESFWLDELHGLEGACGHGVDHQSLPVGRLIAVPPDLTHLGGARPPWAIWTSLGRVSHPPLEYLLLRLWVELFGESEAAVRSLPAACSAAAVAGLLLAVRPWAGVEPAVWASALMCVAGPQVHAGHDARPYSLLMLLATAVFALVGRTARTGPTRWRTAGLSAILLALPLTHFFAAALVAAVGLYALSATRGLVRTHLTAAVGVAALLFAATWGPFMWQQAGTFSTDDRSAAFLFDAGPHHVAHTGWRLLTLPASFLVDARPIPAGYGPAGTAIYTVVVLACLRRRWPALWPLCLAVTFAMLGGLDLARHTRHLNYTRYPLLAAPTVYVALALLPTLHRAAGRAAVVIVIGTCAAFLPRADQPPNADFRALGSAVRGAVRPGEPIVFAGPAQRYAPQVLYLAVSHYAGPLAGPVLLLESPAAPVARAALPAHVWMVADPDVHLARQWLPGYHLVDGQSWPAVGSLLRMEQDPG